MPPFDSADAWTRQVVFEDGFSVDPGIGGDSVVEYDSSSGTYYQAMKDGGSSIPMVSSADPTATAWVDEGSPVSTADVPYSYVSDPGLVEVAGTWYLYFSAGGGSDSTTQEIFVGTSSSPASGYTVQSTGITTDASGWKSNGVGEPDVMYDGANGRWILSLTGNDGSSQNIGMATSTDGINFSEVASNPVKTSGPNGESNVEDQCVVNEDGLYAMYYNGYDSTPPDLFKCIATDIESWTDVADNPIITPSVDADADGPFAPTVIYAENEWHMWYTGFPDASLAGPYYKLYLKGDVDQRGGRVKHYDGSSWNTKPLYEHDGSLWQRPEQLRQYDGSSFNATPPGTASASAPADTVPPLIESFERGDTSGYGIPQNQNTTHSVNGNAPLYHGVRSLKIDMGSGTAEGEMYSTSGLVYYPQPGDTFRTQCQVSGPMSLQLLFAVQSETAEPDAYYAGVNKIEETFYLIKISGGGFTTLDSQAVTIPTGEELTVETDFGAGGSLSATLYDASMTQIASVSASDSSYTSGGIGFRTFHGSGAPATTAIVDHLRVV